MSTKSPDSDQEKASTAVSLPESDTHPPTQIRWALVSSVLATIVVTTINFIFLTRHTFPPGPFIVFWVVPALACSALLSALLVNLKVKHRRLQHSLLSAALSLPMSFSLLFISLVAFIAYGFATSP